MTEITENRQGSLTMWGREMGAVLSVPAEKLSPLGGCSAMSVISDVLLHFCISRKE